MNIRPLHDRVIVRRIEEEKTTASGLIIPDSATEKPSQGEIVAVGKGRITSNGSIVELEVAVGDSVIFGQFAGSEIKSDGESLLVMREDDIVAIID
ncbi:co-chaperone GroES [Candidatus Thioglobus sp.]|jgi:chaperonin GroES|uniref:co-chaperone GroES n=1 Tax=Candidatus Thioglobus sp. TaxID=2026721 RepID=UPI001D9E4D20|nr:co-chaperone GroES [Candidatus Thioglobus sp.]MBT3276539.1 co-chaperone GroES [Candidatus Thioglobus sp.]MBT3446646.1 co-chaperone GroES [Candidatus Thioglobus sp.]MBT3744972.1 co-chaperone GroES [Candidatus Thioglobus sp.]MBT4001049.1 co-chaperone GroES [Candidatus Thioglobus sp.]MBT4181695.1 co-chaperone GroES [Candidatus Thioglobus sp.]